MKKNKGILNLIISFASISIASFIGLKFHQFKFPETNIVIMYILAVIVIARYTDGYLYSLISAIISTCLFNYFFTEPYFTLSVNDSSYIITFIVMTFVSLITSAITAKSLKNAMEARKKEEEAKALYKLTNNLSDAKSIEEIARFSVNIIASILACNVAFLCYDDNGNPEKTFIQQKNGKQIRRKMDNIEEFKYKMERITAYELDEEFQNWPIYGSENILGVVRIPLNNAINMKEEDNKFLRSMVETIALAIDRLISIKKRIQSESEFQQERFRSNLLRAISHDLRTPLSGIMGSAEMIVNMADESSQVHFLAKEICEDSQWLHSLMENILSLTRLQDGNIELKKQLEAVEELVGVAVMNIGKKYPNREVELNLPEDVLFVPMEAKLIGQVLINLLDNAMKHTSVEDEVKITVEENIKAKEVVFIIEDTGEGIDEKDFYSIFQMFYTTNSSESGYKKGIGLGLAICDSIIKAHGGRIYALKKEKGASFIFTLPMEV